MAWWCSCWFNGTRLLVPMERCSWCYMWLFIILLVAFALHHMHSLAYGVMSLLSSDRTGTASFIDAASYLVGYEGRRHGICNAYAFWFLDYGRKASLVWGFGRVSEKLRFSKGWWWLIFILYEDTSLVGIISLPWWLLIFTTYAFISIVGHIPWLIVGWHITYV